MASSTGLRLLGSLTAGLLIGLSITFVVFALAAQSNQAQASFLVASPIALVLGLVVQMIVATGPKRHARG